MNSKTLFCYTMLALLVATTTGCKKMLQLDPPIDSVVFQTAFADDQTATATVNGLYAKIMGSPQYFSSYGLSLYPALMADELYNPNPSTTYDPYAADRLTSSLTAVSNIWGVAYQYIFHANDCIEGLSAATHLTDTVRSRLLGEMKFMRAFCYFHLVNLYGDVPLVLSTDYRQNASLPRTPATEVYNQIMQDLNEAITLLPSTYATAGKGRPNKFTALSLLARFYLYTGNWAKAEETASSVIASGLYSLPPLGSVFLSTSPETIWQISTSGLSYNTYEGNNFIPASASATPLFVITGQLLNAFEVGDNRKTTWLAKNTVGTQTYYYPYKYKVRTGSTITENPVYFRLAEQYLIRAEARARLDNLTTAKTDLNTVRTRAGLPAVTTTDKDLLLAAIEAERRVELFSEGGHRWFDLKRTGRLTTILATLKTGWQPTAALWPLPATQLQLNPFLTQNPGY